MCCDRNDTAHELLRGDSLADWDMCCDRNAYPAHERDARSLADWDMCCDRNGTVSVPLLNMEFSRLGYVL